MASPRPAGFRRVDQRRRGWLLAAAGIVAVIAGACGGDDGSAARPLEASPSATEAGASVASTGGGSGGAISAQTIAQELPFDFNISAYQGETELGGSDVKFSEVVAQGKPVVLNLWAGLCPPCRAEMPDLQAVHEQFEDHIVLFGLDVGPFTGLGNQEDAVSLIQELGITYPAGNTEDARVISQYQVLGMPTTYFMKPDGSVLQKWTGAVNESKLRELVEKLIAASG